MASVSTQSLTVNLDGREIPLAPLEVVNYSALLTEDSAEITKLVRASQGAGFFYLALSSANDQFDGNEYLDNLQSIYRQQESYFSQCLEAKMKDHIDLSLEKGYQHFPDCETLELPYDSFLAGDISPGMDIKAVRNFIPASQAIVQTLVHALSSSVAARDIQAYVNSLHEEGEPSGSGLKLESVPTVEMLEDVPPSEHRDGGTLTLLFCEEYTTELQDAEGAWKFIQPRKDCAIVNVANSLQKASQGHFKSPLHRVGQPTGGVKGRRCVLYYLRPKTSSALY